MSEIKITKDSLENAILKDGQFVSGYVAGTGYISANGDGAHAEGYADGGNMIIASGQGAYAHGYVKNGSINAIGLGAHAEGCETNAIINKQPFLSVTQVSRNQLIGSTEKAEGFYVDSIGWFSIDDKIKLKTDNIYTISYLGTFENRSVIVNGNLDSEDVSAIINSTPGTLNVLLQQLHQGGAHAEGYKTTVYATAAHAEGYITYAEELASHAEGKGTLASNNGAHAEGYSNTNGRIIASGTGAHVEGCSGAVNAYIKASGNGAHAEGYVYGNYITDSSGAGAHAEGIGTQALAGGAHAGGKGTIANQEAMTAIGKYNVSSNTENTLFVVGDGTDADRSDAFRVNSIGSGSVPSSVQAKVNGISDVYLGCPIGTVVMWVGETAPDGWLICNGMTISITKTSADYHGNEYTALYNILPEDFVDEYHTTKYLPDLCAKFPVGAGYSYRWPRPAQGVMINNLQSGGFYANTGDSGIEYDTDNYFLNWHKMMVYNNSSIYIPAEKVGERTINIPPYYALNFIIKYK